MEEASLAPQPLSDAAEIMRGLFYFGAEQDVLYDTIACDPTCERIQLKMQDQASGEHTEVIPEGFSSNE